MSLTLGEKLRQAREARGITISEVAEQTRISALYLESIENNDYRTLPGGIFNKGFVKSYAKYVGVDEKEAIQDYGKLTAEQGENADEPKAYRPEVLTDEHSRSSNLPTIIFAIIILAALVGLVLFGLSYYNGTPSQPIANTNTNKPANSNTQANTNTNTVQMPVALLTGDIKVEFKTTQTVSVESTADGKRFSKNITPEAPETFTATQSLKLRYYKGLADKVQLMINGKNITPPPAPAKGVVVDFTITKDNINQIYQSGAITAAAPADANANTPSR